MVRNNFHIITADVIERILLEHESNVWGIIKNTYLEHANRRTVNPSSFFLCFPEDITSRIIALPAALNYKPKIAGIKWIGSNPQNIQCGMERASATIILNDYETKYPLACLEGSIISKMRTAVSAVIAAEYLSKNKDEILGIIGCGPVSSCIVDILKTRSFQIKKIYLFDKNIERIHDFINYHHNDIDIVIAKSYDELIQNSNLIVFGTSSIKPYIHNVELFDHKPVILHISLRDLGCNIIENSDNFVDDIDHVLNANTSVDLLFQKLKNKNFINGTLADVINNKVQVNYNKTRIFSPMGLGVLDLAVASLVFDIAVNNKSSINIQHFFKANAMTTSKLSK